MKIWFNKKKIKRIVILLVIIILILVAIAFRQIHISRTYDRTVDLYNSGRYEYAMELIGDIPLSYKQSEKYHDLIWAHYWYENADKYVYIMTHLYEEQGLGVDDIKVFKTKWLLKSKYLSEEESYINELSSYVDALMTIQMAFNYEKRNLTEAELLEVVDLLKTANGYGISSSLIDQVQMYNEFKVYKGTCVLDDKEVDVYAHITFNIENKEFEPLTEENTDFGIVVSVRIDNLTWTDFYEGYPSLEDALNSDIICYSDDDTNNQYQYVIVDLNQKKIIISDTN